jgi:hypothetical protein
MPMAWIACSTASRAVRIVLVATAPRASVPTDDDLLDVEQVHPWRVSAAKSTELAPGRSGPVTVIRTLVSAPSLRACRQPVS